MTSYFYTGLPTFFLYGLGELLQSGAEVDRVNGVNAAELTKKVHHHGNIAKDVESKKSSSHLVRLLLHCVFGIPSTLG